MNRKHFISALPAFAGLFSFNGAGPVSTKELDAIIPHYLNAGDLVGITSPAGYITHEEIQPAVDQIHGWSFRTKIGNTIGKRDFGFGGTDAERLADFQAMLDDKEIKAVMCARGGYGTVRIIDQLDFTSFEKNPKWIIGFSDITVLHCHLNRNYGIASIHSKMCNSFPENWQIAEPIQKETILSIRQALTGEKMKYNIAPNVNNKPGKGRGALVGGNLKTIETIAGSKSDLKTTNKILFVEDTGEYLYSIDRMFWNLARTGKLEHLQGLIIGGFKVKPDKPGEEFGRSIMQIVLEKTQKYDYPVCFDFPVGHQVNNYALKHGMTHSLEVKNDSCILKEVN